MKISVVIAAYKGEKYIEEQLRSILPQLGDGDEIIISDDYPAGLTKERIHRIDDRRIKYIEGPAKGLIRNFEHALQNAKGDIIFLCDQDDVWMPGKVSKCVALIEKGNDLVLHDALVTDGELKDKGITAFALHRTNTSYIKNIVQNTFVGCCMVFTRQVAQSVLPFPENLPMHDWWIALAAIKMGYRVALLNESLIKWRRHDENFTGGKTTLMQKIKWRLTIIRCLIPVSKGTVVPGGKDNSNE